MQSKAETVAETEAVPIRSERSTQVLVAGGGVAGIFAALAAARGGASVVLLEQAGFLGGQGTVGGVHTFCGDTDVVNDDWRALLAGLEAFEGALAPFRPNDDGRRFSAEHLKFVAQELLEAAGVEVRLHTSVVAAGRVDDRATHVLVHDAGGIHRIRALQFIDATGDADLVWAAGWPVDKGGPSFAPAKHGVERLNERLPLPMSLYFSMVDTGSPVSSVSPAGAPVWSGDDDLPMTSVYEHDGLVTVKMKVVGFDATEGGSLSSAEQHARRQALALVHHLQTKGYLGRSYPTHRLAWIAPNLGIREGRRVQPILPLTLGHLVSGAQFDDAVAVGSYHIDYHWPADVRRAGTGLTAQVPPYQIPLRAMRPIGSQNVLVPGRCMGGEQIAMSSYRVMAICAQTGFGAGMAAGLAAAGGIDLDDLEPAVVREHLQAAGVRLDLAPYLRYLRARRDFAGRVDLECDGPLAVAFAPDGSVLIAAASKEGVGLARAHPGRPTVTSTVSTGPVDRLALVPQNDRILPSSRRSVEPNSPILASLVIDRDGPSVELGDGVVVVVKGSPTSSMISVPGDVWSTDANAPDLLVRVREGGVLEWALGSAAWTPVPSWQSPSTPVLAATAGGILVAWSDGDGVAYRHIPYDAVLGLEAGHPSNEHNTDLAWLDLIEHPAAEPAWTS
ncbi:hypothetical protein BH10ACT7_BH10ACT7_21040 [soil metagenome]